MKKFCLRGCAALLLAALLAFSTGCSITEIITSMEAEGDSTFMFCDSGSMYMWGDSRAFGGGETGLVGDSVENFGSGQFFTYVPGVVSMAFGDRFGVWLTRDGIVVSGRTECIPITRSDVSAASFAEVAPPTLLCTLNSTGQDSSFPNSYMLVETDLSSARQVAAGDNFWLALLADGRLFGFGYGGHAGHQTEAQSVLLGERGADGIVELTEIGLLTRVSAAPAGECAGIRADGSAVLWGGSFGAPTEYTDAVFTQAESAGDFVLALDEAGNVWRLDGESANRYDGDFVSIAAGEGFAIAVSRSGELWGWGTASHGQLGGAASLDGEPLDVGLSGVIAVSCGRAHAVALRKDGTLWAWGAGEAGQLGTGTADSAVALKLPEKTAKVDIR